MKKKYNAPTAQLMTLHIQSSLMLTLSGGDTGIESGGNSSEEGLPDPDAKEQSTWNTWEEW